jgi:hypothetical protein
VVTYIKYNFIHIGMKRGSVGLFLGIGIVILVLIVGFVFITKNKDARELAGPDSNAVNDGKDGDSGESEYVEEAEDDVVADFALPYDCGHGINSAEVRYGYNVVLDSGGNELLAQGKPFAEGYTLGVSKSYIDNVNDREYARVFSLIAPIRDALMCDEVFVSLSEWQAMTEVLTLNGIKFEQSLVGTPKEQFYSSAGIYEHLLEGEDFHPMMKYLEEAELELKCLAFTDFNFVNPEGENHCEIHGLVEGSGIRGV